MIKKPAAILLFLLLCLGSSAQNTLPDMIELAKKTSYAAQLPEYELKLANIDFAAYKAGLKPSLSFYGNAPVYNKDNYAVTQPDGTIKFLSRSQNYSNIGIGFSQPLPFTGGSLSINTDLYRFDDFAAKTKQYNGTPVFIRLNQPLFEYNSYKWDKQIAPLKLQEANQTMKLAMLQLEYDICRLYFAIIEAQADEQLSIVNLRNTETNLSIEKRRVQAGVSTEDKTMQLEMQQINSQQQKAAAELNIRKAFLTLQTFMNNTDTSVKNLQLPAGLPPISITKEKAIATAKQNLPLYLSFQRKKLEAINKIEEAKKQGRQVDLVASYGLNNAAIDIPAIYRNPQDQQRFSIGFSVPIADWGRRKNAMVAAKTQAEKLDLSAKQEEANLSKEIVLLLYELPLFKQSIFQSLILDSLSQRRFAITNRLFQSGKASLLELQAAQSEKDNAKRNYIAALRQFWEGYYLLQLKTGAKL